MDLLLYYNILTVLANKFKVFQLKAK
jgi:hypothetical protein